jgi:outer membrane protein OmpA-like peptidoglycan-associated protein
MSRSPDRPGLRSVASNTGRRRVSAAALLSVVLAVGGGPAAGAQESPTPPPPPPAGAVGEVLDIVGEVESLDGTESQTRASETVTVALTSDVLFAFDKADLTGEAQARLQAVAEQIQAESAGGVIAIEGHTDDQGSDAYNDDLSQRRAESVRGALSGLLSGLDVTLEASGHGEREPKVPNVVNGQPSEANRAKNRRVEIVYDLKQ